MFLESYNMLALCLATILNRIKSEHPCIVPDFKGDISNVSPHRLMFLIGLSFWRDPLPV